jgi:hypothetical protein
MQLDACLRSIERFAPYNGSVVVLYTFSSQNFADAYETLIGVTSAEFVEQSRDFRRDVLELVDAGYDHTVFHTDDDVFFRAPRAVPPPTDEIAAFSFRLGLNTTYSYAVDRPQEMPDVTSDGDLLAWDWTRAPHDFGYPLSLDGHVMRTDLLLRLLGRIRFDNPNELEDELTLRRYLAPRWMMSFRESCLVSIPVNVVTTTHANRAGVQPSLSPEALNARFLAGERIALDEMDFRSVQGAHQEIRLAFERRVD